MRFWDSSALVPLIVGQAQSSLVDGWVAEDSAIAVWTLTPVELLSAITRLSREGAISERDVDRAATRIDELFAASHAVVDADVVKEHARRLLRVHPLRAADALQLGAAWEWARGRPTGRVFHCFDQRLALAAGREGFRVVPEPE